MARNNGNDELMELLDSFDIDTEYSELSNKMEEFTREKKKREEKEKPVEVETVKIAEPIKTEPVSMGNTIVAPLKDSTSSDVGGKTVVFTNQNVPNTNAGGETVVINEQQIQSFIAEEESTEELLKRQVIKEFNDQPIITAGVKRILFVCVGILVAFILIFAGYKVISGLSDFSQLQQQEETDPLREQYYEELKAWAERYDVMSYAEKQNIEALEQKYNKLTDEQKQEIDQILLSKSGSTFDELLAKSRSDKPTPDKTNNNTELAEQKAQLKAQMEEIKAAMDQYKKEMKDLEQEVSKTEKTYEEYQQSLDAAQEEVDNSLAVLQEIIFDDRTMTQAEKEEKYGSIEKMQEAYEKAQAEYDKKAAEYDFTSMNANVTNAYNEYIQASSDYEEAQANYNYYAEVYDGLKAQLDELNG